MHGPMREKLPLTVTLRVHSLEPDGVQLPGVGVAAPGHKQAHVPPVGDDDVAVYFGLDQVEVVHEVLSVGNSLQKRRLVVIRQRLAAGCPAVPVREAEITREDAFPATTASATF